MALAWTAEEAAGDLVAVDGELAAAADGSPELRLQRVAGYFAGRYGAERGRLLLGSFVRLCLYLDRHGPELRARGLIDETGRTIDRPFLELLLAAIAQEAGASSAAGETVGAVPARDGDGAWTCD